MGSVRMSAWRPLPLSGGHSRGVDLAKAGWRSEYVSQQHQLNLSNEMILRLPCIGPGNFYGQQMTQIMMEASHTRSSLPILKTVQCCVDATWTPSTTKWQVVVCVKIIQPKCYCTV